VVSIGTQGDGDCSSRDSRALASGWLSPILALEIAGRGGRPPISGELRSLIRQMSVENVLWGAPRIQSELLKLGFTVARSTVAKYMATMNNPSGLRWDTFLRNHAPHVTAMDLFVVPTISFIELHVLAIVRLARREPCRE